jgi:hypothetical protein
LYSIYKARGLGRRWSGSYRKALAQLGITTVADFARAIMVMQLKKWQEVSYGLIYRFCQNPISGEPVELPTDKFGAWGWKVTLDELENRGFNWREFLVQ